MMMIARLSIKTAFVHMDTFSYFQEPEKYRYKEWERKTNRFCVCVCRGDEGRSIDAQKKNTHTRAEIPSAISRRSCINRWHTVAWYLFSAIVFHNNSIDTVDLASVSSCLLSGTTIPKPISLIDLETISFSNRIHMEAFLVMIKRILFLPNLDEWLS